MNFYISDYEIRTDSHELLYNNRLQKTEPLVFRLLIYMLKHPDRVLSRDELLKEVWQSRIVSDSALSATVCAARRAIGDTGSKQQCIKTVSGCGYRFVATFTCSHAEEEQPNTQSEINITNDLRERQNAPQSPTVADTNSRDSADKLIIPDQPSIAVMDFVDLSASKKSALLAYGLTNEINAGLARLPHFFVIARDSAAVLSRKKLTAPEIGACLGVRYLVNATIVCAAKHIRVTLSITDTVRNAEIGSEHFDQPDDDTPQMRDEIIMSIVTVIDSTIEQTEVERAFLTPTESLSAWESYYRGLWHSQQTTLKDAHIAQQFFQQAVSLDTRFARAYAGLSFIHTSFKILNTSSVAKNDDDDTKKAFEYAQRSLQYCSREIKGYVALGRILFFVQKYEQALQATEQGIQVNSNDVECYSFRGICAVALGLDAQAEQCLDKVERFNPFDPYLFSIKTARAISLVHQKRYDEAVELSLLATRYANAYFSTYAIATACLQLAGHRKKAQHYAAKVLALQPNYSIELYESLNPHADEATRFEFIDALRSAGIPERGISL